MRTTTRPAARRRSQTRSGRRSRRTTRSYVRVPLQVGLKALALPAWGVQRTLAAVATVVLAVILVTLFVSPRYAIADVVPEGNEGVATQDVIDATAFARKQNAFLLRTAEVEAVVRKLPGVVSARARVLLPDRLLITVSDTRPSVAWVSGSLVYWIDQNGVVLDPQTVTTERLLTIKDLSGRAYRTGDKVDLAAIATAQNLMLKMPREVQGFEYQREGDLIVVGNQGWRAQFSTWGDLNQQVNALLYTLNTVRGISFIDVRTPDRVTYR